MRVFVVKAPTAAEPRPQSVESKPVTIEAIGDDAKRSARELLLSSGYLVRSLSWAPNRQPGHGDELVATVQLKTGAKDEE